MLFHFQFSNTSNNLLLELFHYTFLIGAKFLFFPLNHDYSLIFSVWDILK